MGLMLAPMLSKMYILIHDFFVTRPPGHLQAYWFAFYYCHVVEKSDVVCTTYGAMKARVYLEIAIKGIATKGAEGR